MSVLQNNAKPFLEPLLRGDWPELDADAISAVCRWVKMVVISLEFAHPETVAIPEEERLAFSRTQEIGDNWQILLGRNSEPHRTGAFWHRGSALADAPARDQQLTCNVQTTTFYFGRMVVHAISGPSKYMPDADVYARDLGFRAVWPLPDVWPPPPLYFSREGVVRVGGFYWLRWGLPAEAHFGMLQTDTPWI
jgi:hypothetical protein